MEKKKRIALSAGLLAAALLFNPGVLASDDTQEPENSKGHFGFLPPQPPLKLPGSHYFLVKVSSDFSRLGQAGGINYQITGVNVYWKTKGIDQERGRPNASFIGPNLPNCSFGYEAPCDVTLANAEGGNEDRSKGGNLYQLGSTEHLEGLVWVYSNHLPPDSDGDIPTGAPSYLDDRICPDLVTNPDLNHAYDGRRTRFFRGFYNGFEDCGNGIENIPGTTRTLRPDGTYDAKVTNPDNDVHLSAMFNSQDSSICNDAGPLYCGGSGNTPSGYIYIPSNNLKYMVIEVMGFEAHSHDLHTFPIIAFKYTNEDPDDPENYKMEFVSTQDKVGQGEPVSYMVPFYNKGFSSYRNLNPFESDLHWNEEENNIDGKKDTFVGYGDYGPLLDFKNIDYLEVSIKSLDHMVLNGPSDMAKGNVHNTQGGVGVRLHKYDWKCSEGPEVVPDGAELNGATEEEYLKANCAYKTRY
ncbi:TPA: hypothetical protein KNG88_001416 [Citrobacter braakii]|nr:hypothetical protein [Citrobacter braakii]